MHRIECIQTNMFRTDGVCDACPRAEKTLASAERLVLQCILLDLNFLSVPLLHLLLNVQ